MSVISLSLACTAITGCGGGDASNPSVQAPAAIRLAAQPIPLQSGMSYGTSFWAEGSSATGGSGTPVADVNCLVNEDYHIHTHLTILRDGRVLAIPGHIGLKGCAYELHTHDLSGVIHVETASYRKFTLGQFFAVWGQPLGRDNVAHLTGQPVVVYLNDGTGLTEYTGDLQSLELKGHREITIVVGSAPAEIPSYTWPDSL
ncbi:hypothetical protein SAMN05192549_105305 [Duganella sacchari]|uniref:Uncharacterized protein n=1 Tax=Duganella sacchari TaxID=551987 RepID=A0A1M7PQI9_9BURK|nr:hypothetical protein [Duganella sacchari]SHN19603.1 hypothetical protein SAMN05192549_105305 [Duganella sacchari]